MNKYTPLLLHLVLLVIVVLELTGRITDRIQIEYFVKPLIMIWMGIYFLLFRRKHAFTIPVLLAIFCAWVGDIMLMLSDSNELYFFGGAGGFLLAQIAYIYTFVRYSENGGRGYLRRNPLIGILFIGYATAIYWLLYPGLEGIMKSIVLVYALSLVGMSMMALNRHTRVYYRSFLLVFIGSILFVLSDSMLAINKFLVEFSLAGFWTMATYIAAQYLIMRGLVLEQEKSVRT